MASLGESIPSISQEERQAFERGKVLAAKHFTHAEGVGPTLNAVSCAACHERPVIGGASSLYRNYVLTDHVIIRAYGYGSGISARPAVDHAIASTAQRNAVPLFGMGLLQEISDHEIMQREDPDDLNADGISGRANYEGSKLGRFGLKAQSADIASIVRHSLLNHMGITTQNETDTDDIADPELSDNDLSDLVSFATQLAAPQLDPLSTTSTRGQSQFINFGCNACHTPSLLSPRGPLHLFSDLLLHDMGPDLADGITMQRASGSEFRTQPLWGIAATGPYLHDGRASSIKEAIVMHGGEAEASRTKFQAAGPDDQNALLVFLKSLGGSYAKSQGLLPPNTPMPEAGSLGGPSETLIPYIEKIFLAGRRLFDADIGISQGLGSPRFNADSCRACHFQPAIGGAGPNDVNVIRHGILSDGLFQTPAGGTILHKHTAIHNGAVFADPTINVFEHRQTPSLLGLGLVDKIPDNAILHNEDPTDQNADGISGRAAILQDGRLGRFGWKAQVPSLAEFMRDATSAELGITVMHQAPLTFGREHDDDLVDDPEFSSDADMRNLLVFVAALGPPLPGPRGATEQKGEQIFGTLGCDSCHIPSLDGSGTPVLLYSDLLLHAILPEDALGIEDGPAGIHEFRTPPLWGIAQTAPYLHSGAADTLEEAIEGHAGEGEASRNKFRNLSVEDKNALIAFLKAL